MHYGDCTMVTIYYTSSFAHFSYSECGLHRGALHTHTILLIVLLMMIETTVYIIAYLAQCALW